MEAKRQAATAAVGIEEESEMSKTPNIDAILDAMETPTVEKAPEPGVVVLCNLCHKPECPWSALLTAQARKQAA